MSDQKKEIENEVKLPKYLLIVLIGLQMIIFLSIFMISISKGKSMGDDGKGVSSFFPFWIVVLIPLIVLRKKRYAIKKEKYLLWILVGTASLLFIAMILFLLKVIS